MLLSKKQSKCSSDVSAKFEALIPGANGITNKLAIYLCIILFVLVAMDAVIFGWANTAFLARKFLDLVAWIKFWR